MTVTIRRALLSVTDKSGVQAFARALSEHGIEIVASGGTASAIRGAGVNVKEIGEVTAFPEIMDGRVKTLHPKIHGGILADRSKKEHLQKAEELGIGLIDLVAVNLYRFRDAAGKTDLGEREVVEEIDIGGPTLIRAAAKNYRSVAVVVDPADYERIIEEMDESGGSVSMDTRKMLASKAFHHTAAYDAAISGYFDRLVPPADGLPASLITAYDKVMPLRYGENPHQRGGLYAREGKTGGFADLEQLQGKELSYNNIQDLGAAFFLARDLGRGSCAIIKHTNPCGAANCGGPEKSFLRAKKTDPVSAFGSVVAFNSAVDEAAAAACRELFLEVIVARGFSKGAMELLGKKKKLRLVSIPEGEWEREIKDWSSRELGGLLLLQDMDEGFPELEDWKVVTKVRPGAGAERALRLAWRVVKHIRSNAIVICDEEGTVGVGAGQMSRVDSCRIAVEKARREGLKTKGASAASDAFFPFPDGVEVLAGAGVEAVVQPGGSIRDEEVIKAAEGLGIAMVMTGRRHFRH